MPSPRPLVAALPVPGYLGFDSADPGSA